MLAAPAAFTVRAAVDIEDCRATIPVQIETWGSELVIPPSVLLAATQEGGYVGLGYAEGDEALAGFVFGFVGIHRGLVRHHSQRLAVRQAHRRTGLAAALKAAQRQHCLDLGIDKIVWTMDPLQPRNARFNFAKLGAVARTYLTNFYGVLTDPLNAGLPSDRLLVEWSIDDERARRRLSGSGQIPQLEDVERMGVAHLLRAEGGRPCPTHPEPNTSSLLLEVPPDIDALKRASADLALSWRMASRESFLAAFHQGFTAVDLLRDREGQRAAYLLARGED